MIVSSLFPPVYLSSTSSLLTSLIVHGSINRCIHFHLPSPQLFLSSPLFPTNNDDARANDGDCDIIASSLIALFVLLGLFISARVTRRHRLVFSEQAGGHRVVVG